MRTWNPKRLFKLAGASVAMVVWIIAIIRTARARASETISEEKRLRGALQELLTRLSGEIVSLRDDWVALYAASGAINARAKEAKLKLITTLQASIAAVQEQANQVPIPAGRRAAARAAEAIRTLSTLLARAEEVEVAVQYQREELLTMRSWFSSDFS